MRKIAILILVHKDSRQIDRLIKYLAKDFDVYIHVDKRASLSIKSMDNVFVYSEYRSYWGSFNQIMATLFLLKQACQRKYERYLLISGQDIPIKSNKYIAGFFENNTTEYLEWDKMPVAGLDENGGLDRMTKYWPNAFHRGKNSLLLKVLFKIQSIIFSVFSKLKPRACDYAFTKGANWMNITHTCVQEIIHYLEVNPGYINRFKWTKCADEIFFQTIVNSLEGLEISNETLRYINWSDGPEYPRIFRKADFEKVMNSKELFARKFDASIDAEVIDRIYTEIGK